MADERDIEKIVRRTEALCREHPSDPELDVEYILLIIADWRAKKAEIERLKTSRDLCEKELDVLSASHKDLAYRLARTGPNPPLPL